MPEPPVNPRFWLDRLDSDADLDGVLAVEAESFTNPWTREMYTRELANPAVCHVYVVRTERCPVVGFCSMWLIVDEAHLNNVAILPEWRGRGLGTALVSHVLRESTRLGALRATLEVRASNDDARRLYARLGFVVEGVRRRYYTNPDEDALILWKRVLDTTAPPG